jgi:altronate hydrolase
MFNRMDQDMDINCGTVVDDGESIQAVGRRIFERLIDVASGDPTKSEQYGFGDDEFIPWQIGAVM